MQGLRHQNIEVAVRAYAAIRIWIALIALTFAHVGHAQPIPSSEDSHDGFVIPFELVNKNIFIKVIVGDSRPLWFLLDTGIKYAVIDLPTAKTLGLELGDQVQVAGAGQDATFGNFLRNSPFRIPGLADFSQPLFLALPLGDLANSSGHELAGILGFDFISQFVVEIDYVKHILTLHDKASFNYNGSGEVLPIAFNAASHPLIYARVVDVDLMSIEGQFVVDTGSGAALILNKSFADRKNLLCCNKATVPWMEARGIGGKTPGVVGRITQLKIGRFAINNPVTVFSQAITGALASQESDGNIGAAILEKFHVILDYARKRIILEPNARFPDPIEYSHSGMALVGSGHGVTTFKVTNVAENSPASESGIRVGDIIASIDGKPAAKYTLSQLRERLKGTGTLRLVLQRGKRSFRIGLQLRPLI